MLRSSPWRAPRPGRRWPPASPREPQSEAPWQGEGFYQRRLNDSADREAHRSIRTSTTCTRGDHTRTFRLHSSACGRNLSSNRRIGLRHRCSDSRRACISSRVSSRRGPSRRVPRSHRIRNTEPKLTLTAATVIIGLSRTRSWVTRCVRCERAETVHQGFDSLNFKLWMISLSGRTKRSAI
jgi:hypothetical protein